MSASEAASMSLTGVLSAPQEGLLLSFCNQAASPECSLCFMDPASGRIRWLDVAGWPDAVRESLAGICGLAIRGDRLVLVTQSEQPSMVLWDLQESRLLSTLALRACRDPHSLVWHQGFVHVVSTGTNEIYRISLVNDELGGEERYWTYPGTSPDRDQVHLNGLTIDGEGRLIASCFGERTAEGRWGAAGRIFYLDNNQTLHDGLNQPHSPVITGDTLAFAESKTGRVYLHERSATDGWALRQAVTVGGYPRGIAFRGDVLFVGISADRKVSRSQKVQLESGHEPNPSALIRLDHRTGEVESIPGVSLYGNEIYDIVPLDGPVATDDLETAMRVRVADMESVVNRQMVALRELQQEIQGFSAEYQNVLGRYHDVLAERDALRGQLARTRGIWSRLRDRLTRKFQA